jgi:hypothetical protein
LTAFDYGGTVRVHSNFMNERIQFWLVVGKPENWHTAFDYRGIWGLRQSQKRYWDKMQENRDVIFFYVTSAISGIVGTGVVRTKLHQLSPLWPEERAKNEVIWPFRFEFDVISCFPPEVWQDQRIAMEELRSRARSGFQDLEPPLARKILAMMPSSRPDDLMPPLGSVYSAGDKLAALEEETTPKDDPHKKAQNQISEIGRLQKFVVETEVALENRRVDVVWRRVQRSAPSFVFEVQVSGNITEAMSKLKYAYELWNSNIYLVGKPEHKAPALQLCDGAFHEIRGRIRFLELAQIEELHGRKRAYRDYEDQLGIFA